MQISVKKTFPPEKKSYLAPHITTEAYFFWRMSRSKIFTRARKLRGMTFFVTIDWSSVTLETGMHDQRLARKMGEIKTDLKG